MRCKKCGEMCTAKTDGKIGSNIAVSNCCNAEIEYIQHHQHQRMKHHDYIEKSELEQIREDYNTYMLNHLDPPRAVLLYVKALREEISK